MGHNLYLEPQQCCGLGQCMLLVGQLLKPRDPIGSLGEEGNDRQCFQMVTSESVKPEECCDVVW